MPWARNWKHTVGIEAAKVGRARNSGDSKGIEKIGRVNHNRASNVEVFIKSGKPRITKKHICCMRSVPSLKQQDKLD